MRTAHLLPMLTILALTAPTGVSAQTSRDPRPAPDAPASGYSRGDQDWRGDRDDRWRDDQRRGGPDDGRYGRGNAPVFRYDAAFRTGFSDGYEAGFGDARRRHRYDPVREGRYRGGDHRYDRRYGPRDLYRVRYRDGFLRGYRDGFEDARRYNRYGNRPWWWPF